MEQYKNLLKKVKDVLDKIKDVDNDIVKEAYGELNEFISSIKIEEPEAKEEKVAEEPKAEENSEEEETTTEDESTEEENSEESSTETKEDTEDLKQQENKKTEQELSIKVAKKLEEAAIELNAKTEIIEGYKAKITELSEELSKYKEKEALELKAIFDKKANRLIELYSKLNIKKTFKEIELNFSESQVDKLIKDLEVMQSNINKPIKRQTIVNPGLELSSMQNKQEQFSPDDVARLLLNI